jgi:hypothetical protein
LPARLVEVLRRAYRQLDAPPEGLPRDTKCLLDDRGRLHALSEALTGRFHINDHPALASAAAQAGAPVAFADAPDRRAVPFLVAAGARQLSDVATRLGTERGPERPHDASLRADATLKRLQAPSFASAVAALVSTVSGPERALSAPALAARLARIERIAVVDGIERLYGVAGTAVAIPADQLVLDDQIVVDRVPGSYELRRAVADAVAVVADRSPLAEQVLGDPVYFLLRCRSVPEMQRELQRRRVVWRPDSDLDAADDDVEENESTSLADAIARSVVRNALQAPGRPAGTERERLSELPKSPRRPLPELRDVNPRPAGPLEDLQERAARYRSGGGWSRAWTPRDHDGREEDRALGRRGEEIVLALERGRVERLGWPPDRVVWTAADTPFADHDIKSVDDEGGDLWVEVKSTTGRDGRFKWPGAEFRLAVRARRRYFLYRVYEADTTTPSWSCFRDPIGLFEAGGLHLDLDLLVGDVGPLAADEDNEPQLGLDPLGA